MGDLLIDRQADISPCERLRWTLHRSWGTGSRVCFIGHNPSTADHEVDDPTVKRWMHFARAWGHDGFVAVNLYPIRATDPSEARKWIDWESRGPDWWARDAIDHNLGLVAQEAKAAALVVACWGAIAADWNWAEHVIEHIVSEVAPWPGLHVFGLTKSGAPIHPMARGNHRVPDHAQPALWRPTPHHEGAE